MLLRQILRTPIFLYHSICSIPSPKPYFFGSLYITGDMFLLSSGMSREGAVKKREMSIFFFFMEDPCASSPYYMTFFAVLLDVVRSRCD